MATMAEDMEPAMRASLRRRHLIRFQEDTLRQRPLCCQRSRALRALPGVLPVPGTNCVIVPAATKPALTATCWLAVCSWPILSSTVRTPGWLAAHRPPSRSALPASPRPRKRCAMP